MTCTVRDRTLKRFTPKAQNSIVVDPAAPRSPVARACAALRVGTEVPGGQWLGARVTGRRAVSALRCFPLVAVFALLLPAAQVLAGQVSGSNSTDLAVPDKGGFVASTITIDDAPEGAVVKSVDLSFKAKHSSPSDLNIDVNADAESELGNYDLWAGEAGSGKAASKSVKGVDAFDGVTANRTWYLYVRDEKAGGEGEIDEWSITVHYATPGKKKSKDSKASESAKAAKPDSAAKSGPAPKISSVSPNPVVGVDHSQPFTIKGSNFICEPDVTLRDLRDESKYTKRAIASCSADSITINPNFKNKPTKWSVEVINPDGKTSGEYRFDVKAPPPGKGQLPAPRIDSVSPDPVSGADRAQRFTIKGANFVCNPNVELQNRTEDDVFPKRRIGVCSASSITINPNFQDASATWTVEVINPDGQSSGKRRFDVKASK